MCWKSAWVAGVCLGLAMGCGPILDRWDLIFLRPCPEPEASPAGVGLVYDWQGYAHERDPELMPTILEWMKRVSFDG